MRLYIEGVDPDQVDSAAIRDIIEQEAVRTYGRQTGSSGRPLLAHLSVVTWDFNPPETTYRAVLLEREPRGDFPVVDNVWATIRWRPA